MTLQIGHELRNGRYRIQSQLGQGGMGTVYLARDLNLRGRWVAIKENIETSRTPIVATATPTRSDITTPQAVAAVDLTPTLASIPAETPVPTRTETSVPTANVDPTRDATIRPTPTPESQESIVTAIATSTPSDTSTPTSTATIAATSTLTPTIGSISATVRTSSGDLSVELLGPLEEALKGRQIFTWTPIDLNPGQAYELVFWPLDGEPLRDGRSPVGASLDTTVRVDLDTFNRHPDLPFLERGRVLRWGVLLVEVEPSFQRLKSLSTGHRFVFERTGTSGNNNSNAEPNAIERPGG